MVDKIPRVNIRHIYNYSWGGTFYGIWKYSFITPGMYSSGIRVGYVRCGRDSLLRDCFFYNLDDQIIDSSKIATYSIPRKADENKKRL
jgi:hypothetical protein